MGEAAASSAFRNSTVPMAFYLPGTCAPRELREKIQPEILELIKQQRLNRLCEGSSFRKIGNRRRQGGRRHRALGQCSPTGLPKARMGLLRGPSGSRQASVMPLPSTVLAYLLVFLGFQNGSGTAAWH